MRIILSLSFLFLLISCGENKTEQAAQTQLHKEVMVVHDEVMPLTGDLNRAKRNLKKILNGPNNEKIDEPTREKILSSITNLQKANEGMNSWMRNYKKPKGQEHEAAMKYLADQLQVISNVSKSMKSSLAEGNALLNSMK